MCEYNDKCFFEAAWIVNARYREASLVVCERHLSSEIRNAATFNDPRYPRRISDDGVRVFPVR